MHTFENIGCIPLFKGTKASKCTPAAKDAYKDITTEGKWAVTSHADRLAILTAIRRGCPDLAETIRRTWSCAFHALTYSRNGDVTDRIATSGSIVDWGAGEQTGAEVLEGLEHTIAPGLIDDIGKLTVSPIGRACCAAEELHAAVMQLPEQVHSFHAYTTECCTRRIQMLLDRLLSEVPKEGRVFGDDTVARSTVQTAEPRKEYEAIRPSGFHLGKEWCKEGPRYLVSRFAPELESMLAQYLRGTDE